MRKLGFLVSSVVVTMVCSVVACSSKSTDAPIPTPEVDSGPGGGCDQDPTAPGCTSDSGDGGADTSVDAPATVTIDPSLLAPHDWSGKSVGGTTFYLKLEGGPTNGTASGTTIGVPSNTPCGPAAINTLKWTGTWKYESSSQ